MIANKTITKPVISMQLILIFELFQWSIFSLKDHCNRSDHFCYQLS